ncbi:hypothetical protein [Flavobacterium sp. JP2137]|uniref:hypothetical protein n=1 Tax=Flavobacterium sp. JP2137 TaxID=3414510 RepID=UPI003D2FD7D1
MSSLLLAELAACSALLKSRTAVRDLVGSKPGYVDLIFTWALDIKAHHHHKACWIAELLVLDQPAVLHPYVAKLCSVLPHIQHESAKRPLSKMAFLLVSSPDFKLTKKQQEQVANSCLDWLISDTKVATQCYALDILSELAVRDSELLELIRDMVDQRYSSSKPSFQRRAEKLMRRHFQVGQKKIR